MLEVEKLKLVIRDADFKEHNATLQHSFEGYELNIEGRTVDFIMLNSEAVAVVSMLRNSNNKLTVETIGTLNSTVHGNVTMITPDDKRLPLAVVKGDYLVEPGSLVIAFNNATFRGVTAENRNTYYDYEYIGEVVRIETSDWEEK